MQLALCVLCCHAAALVSALLAPAVRFLNDEPDLPLFSVSSNLAYMVPAVLGALHWRDTELNIAVSVVMVDLTVYSARWHLNILNQLALIVGNDQTYYR